LEFFVFLSEMLLTKFPKNSTVSDDGFRLLSTTGCLLGDVCRIVQYGGSARVLLVRGVPLQEEHLAAPAERDIRRKKVLLHSSRTIAGGPMLQIAGDSLSVRLR
jgi:hypothetical protein